MIFSERVGLKIDPCKMSRDSCQKSFKLFIFSSYEEIYVRRRSEMFRRSPKVQAGDVIAHRNQPAVFVEVGVNNTRCCIGRRCDQQGSTLVAGQQVQVHVACRRCTAGGDSEGTWPRADTDSRGASNSRRNRSHEHDGRQSIY